MSPPTKQKTPSQEWYYDLPGWIRVIFQLGFASVFVAYVFITSQQDRAMFRAELQEERQELRAAVLEFRKAVERANDEQKTLKSDVERLKKTSFVGPPDPKKNPILD